MTVGAVLIGRNEGARLERCLASVIGMVDHVVYVDSGSSDGSCAKARAAGAEVVTLDMERPFTAARARNAGLTRLTELDAASDLVQFVDGDCEVQPGWIDTATGFLRDNPQVAVVCGRRRERFPEASVYNRLIDAEWDTAVGEARSCGGDALMRVAAVQGVGGFNAALIAGEEPELCVRLRRAGWRVWRLDAEMTLHDAALTRFGQWWTRARRGGHACAEGAALHGASPEHHKVVELGHMLAWGMALPLLTLAGLMLTPWALLLLLPWPVQILRLRLRGESWERAVFLMLAKLPEAQGALRYYRRRLTGEQAALIEYK